MYLQSLIAALSRVFRWRSRTQFSVFPLSWVQRQTCAAETPDTKDLFLFETEIVLQSLLDFLNMDPAASSLEIVPLLLPKTQYSVQPKKTVELYSIYFTFILKSPLNCSEYF